MAVFWQNDEKALFAFETLNDVFALQGEKITQDAISDVIRYEINAQSYYIKRYYSAGRGIRAFRRRPRIQAEWENLQYFAQLGIRTVPIIAFGMQRRLGAFVQGAMITQGVDAQDLASLVNQQHTCFNDRLWLNKVSQQVADFTRLLHSTGFAHNDLKWRNILVDEQAKVYFIDCPTGKFWRGPFLAYRIIKDLACLDKVARKQLSRTQRLRFYMQYRQIEKLAANDKKQVQKVEGFFKGRE